MVVLMRITVILGLVVLSLVGPISRPDARQGTEREVEILAERFSFTPSEVRVPLGGITESTWSRPLLRYRGVGGERHGGGRVRLVARAVRLRLPHGRPRGVLELGPVLLARHVL